MDWFALVRIAWLRGFIANQMVTLNFGQSKKKRSPKITGGTTSKKYTDNTYQKLLDKDPVAKKRYETMKSIFYSDMDR